jgi:hypothetical protein
MKAAAAVAACALLGAFGDSAFADNPDPTRELLMQALIANADGKCPGDIMVAALKSRCDGQVGALKGYFARLGELRSVERQRTADTPNGPAAIYVVHFANGNWTWMANVNSDGKLLVMGTGQEPVWN